jgi:hypothetical protein
MREREQDHEEAMQNITSDLVRENFLTFAAFATRIARFFGKAGS